MANQENIDRINLFEGVVIGIYGNWLISLLDKISFEKKGQFAGSWYQPLCIITSFSTILLLFAFSIFRPEFINKRMGFLLGFGHAVANIGALWVEGMTSKMWFFSLVGTFLFYIIFIIEMQRVRIRNP